MRTAECHDRANTLDTTFKSASVLGDARWGGCFLPAESHQASELAIEQAQVGFEPGSIRFNIESEGD